VTGCTALLDPPTLRAVVLQERVRFRRRELALVVPSPDQDGTVTEDLELDPGQFAMTP
jgi:hypothetical protein